MTEKKLSEFAELVLKLGVNVQENQGVEIACPVELKTVAETFAKEAYKAGAGIVRIRWDDEVIDRINFENAATETLTDIPRWFIDSKNYLVEKNFCYVAIAAEDPNAFKGIPAEKIAAVGKAKGKLLKKFSDAVMNNGIRWCVVSMPTLEWAKQVFPHSEEPTKLLEEAIEKTMRLDLPDPLKAWEEHIFNLDRRAERLNAENFDYLHFKNSLGTDLKVYLADEHVWLSAKEKAADGVDFVANMPTEEVFTAPHCFKTEGVVKSALPLNYNGSLIENFSLKFRKGKVVDYYAEKGGDTLKALLSTDKGTVRIGEVALIGKNSPIAKQGILFYNTLFDENASCHIALGKAYPTTVKGGDEMSKTELKSHGANDSIEHVDFMIGTPDLSVTGIKKNGEKVAIFFDGEWVI